MDEIKALAQTEAFGNTSGAVALQDDMDVNGDFDLNQVTFTPGSASVNVAGDFENQDGTFTAGTSILVFDSDSSQSVTTDWATFNDMIVANSASITFTDGFTVSDLTNTTGNTTMLFQNDLTVTITGTLTLDGTSGNLITLDTDDGAQNGFWFNVSGGAASVSYLNVDNADALSNDIYCSYCTDGGNNNSLDAGTPDWVFLNIYTWTGSTDGSWGTQGNWDLGDGSAGDDGFPDDNSDKAVINADTANDTIDSGGNRTIGELEISGTFPGTLSLGGNLTIDDAGDWDGDLTLSSPGTFDVNNQNITIDGSTTLSSGLMKTGTGDVTFGNGSGTDNVTISGGELQFESNQFNTDVDFSNVGTWTNSGGTINFLTLAQNATLPAKITSYYDLIVNSASRTITTNSTLDVNGTFTLTDGTLDLDTNDNLASFAGDVTLNGGTFTLGANTVLFDGDLTYTDNIGAVNFGSLIIGGDAKSSNLGSDLVVNDLTVSTGDFLYTNGYDIDIAATVDIQGTIDMTDDGESDRTFINVAGDWTSSSGAIVPAASSVIFDAVDTDNAITMGSTTFYDVRFNDGGGDAGGWTLQDDMLVANDFYVDATDTDGAGFDLNDKELTVMNDLTIGLNGELTAGAGVINVDGDWDSSAGTTNYGTGTVNLTGTGTFKFGGSNYLYDISCAANGQTTTLLSHLRASNVLTLGTGTLMGPIYNVYLWASSGTPFVNNGASIDLYSFYYAPVSSGTLTVTGTDYGFTNLGIAPQQSNTAVNLSGDLTANGWLSLSYWQPGKINHVFNTNGYALDITGLAIGNGYGNGPVTLNLGSSSVDIGTSGLYANTDGGSHTLNLETSSIATAGKWQVSNGTGSITVNPGTSTVTFDGTADQAMTLNGQGFYNLTLANTGAGGSDDITFDDDLDVNGDFILTDGDFNVGSYSLAFAQDFTATGGSWTADGETLYFDGTELQNVTANNATFNDMVLVNSTTVQFTDNFTVSDLTNTTAGSTMFFENDSSITISGALTLTGGAGDLIFLDTHDGAANNFIFSVTSGAATVDYLSVHHADAANNDITCRNCVDGLTNNSGDGDALWKFGRARRFIMI